MTTDETGMPDSLDRPVAVTFQVDSESIVFEYVTSSSSSDQAGDTQQEPHKDLEMDRAQVQDLITASEARTDLNSNKTLNEVRLMRNETAFSLERLGANLEVSKREVADLTIKIDAVKADNIRTRSTVRTSAVSLSFGLASLFVAVSGLLLSGLVGSFNVGTKMDEVSRAQAIEVVKERDALGIENRTDQAKIESNSSAKRTTK